MPQSNRIYIDVYPAGSDSRLPLAFSDVNFVSFVSSPGGRGEGTYGIPALLGESHVKEEGLPFTVVYVNPANITAMRAVRQS